MNKQEPVSGAFFKPVKGIYKITNAVTGRVYIGQSRTVQSRLSSHFTELERGKHISATMQADWNQHGPDSFRVEVLEWVEGQGNRLIREAEIIAETAAAGVEVYNTSISVAETVKSNVEARKARLEAREKAAAEKHRVLSLKKAARVNEHGTTEAGSHSGSKNVARRKNDIHGSWELSERKPIPSLASIEQGLRLSEVDLRTSQEGIGRTAEPERPPAESMDANGQPGNGYGDVQETLPEHEDYNENEDGEYIGSENVSKGQWSSDSDEFLYAIQQEMIGSDDLAWFLRTYIKQDILEAAKPRLTGTAIFTTFDTIQYCNSLHRKAEELNMTYSQMMQALADDRLGLRWNR